MPLMKNPSIRIIPARESLRRVHGEGAADLDVSSIDLMLRMMNAVDVVKGVIFDELKAATGLSEGKFTLMLCLRAFEPCGTYARRAGTPRQDSPGSLPARGGVCRAPHVRGARDADRAPRKADGAF